MAVHIEDDDDLPKITSLEEARKSKMGFSEAPTVDKIENEDDIVKLLNKVYATAIISGKFYVLKEKADEVEYLSKKDFMDSLQKHKFQTLSTTPKGESKQTFKPISEIWLNSVKSREYERVIFDPQHTYPPESKVLNFWKGFVTEPIEGDCSLTLAYIKDVIASNDEDIYNWILNFLAHMVQRPWEKPEVAFVMIGMKGVGKTFFMHIVQTLIDGSKGKQRHCFMTSNPEDIYGQFRSHLQHKIALLLEEVTWGGDRRHESQLKDMITNKSITINVKHGPIITTSNLMRMIMGANPGWVVPASQDERRYIITNVNNQHQQDHEYFKALSNELHNGGYEALMYVLSHRNIEGFNCREAFNTNALADQKAESLDIVENWWQNVITKGQMPIVGSDGGFIYVGRERLYDDFMKEAKRSQRRQILPNQRSFGIKLNACIPKVEGNKILMNSDGRRCISLIGEKRVGNDGNRIYCYVIPSLDICREIWDFKLKKISEWKEPNEWEMSEYSGM